MGRRWSDSARRAPSSRTGARPASARSGRCSRWGAGQRRFTTPKPWRRRRPATGTARGRCPRAAREPGTPAGALDALRVARERAPQRADILKLEGDIAVTVGNTQAGLDAYQAALALEPHYVQVYVDVGKTHEARGDPRAAEASFRAALEILPTHAEAALALANLYRRSGSPAGGGG